MRSEIVRKLLEIPAIQDMRTKHKQICINHLERMDNNRLSMHALNYKPRGRRGRGLSRKRWQSVDAGTGQTTVSMEEEEEEGKEEEDDDDDDDIELILCKWSR